MAVVARVQAVVEETSGAAGPWAAMPGRYLMEGAPEAVVPGRYDISWAPPERLGRAGWGERFWRCTVTLELGYRRAGLGSANDAVSIAATAADDAVAIVRALETADFEADETGVRSIVYAGMRPGDRSSPMSESLLVDLGVEWVAS